MSGIGPQRPNDPRGWLVFDGLPNDLQNAEDSTQDADHRRLHRDEVLTPVSFTRPATAAERELLGHLNFSVPEKLATTVRWLSNGLRNRRWPTLENGS